MATLIDTDVAIHLRDGDAWVEEMVPTLSAPLYISMMTRIELENGLNRDPRWAVKRKAALASLLTFVETQPFGMEEFARYQAIVASVEFSRRKIADRMTAATALAHAIPLATLNGRDFLDVPGLELIAWERPPDTPEEV